MCGAVRCGAVRCGVQNPLASRVDRMYRGGSWLVRNAMLLFVAAVIAVAELRLKWFGKTVRRLSLRFGAYGACKAALMWCGVQYMCSMRPLSDLMARIDWKRHSSVSLVKIDVEGAEWEVLQGMSTPPSLVVPYRRDRYRWLGWVGLCCVGYAGISDADYARINQLVVEVHEVDG